MNNCMASHFVFSHQNIFVASLTVIIFQCTEMNILFTFSLSLSIICSEFLNLSPIVSP